MTDRPIIFSATMIRALLAGAKTQTRRPVYVEKYAEHLRGYASTGRLHAYYGDHRLGLEFVHSERGLWDEAANPAGLSAWYVPIPFHTGQRLWVREAHALIYEGVHVHPIYRAEHVDAALRGPSIDERWRPSIHMPRWASRITLHVEEVRVQRVQDISEEDARAEGAPWEDCWPTYRQSFEAVWDSIHGPDAWDRNDWVAAIRFRPVLANIDAPEAA